MKKIIYTILLFFLIGFSLKAQDILKLEDAIKIALENNYEIKIAKNELKIDVLNNSLGNSGMLPNIGLTVNNTNSLQNITQTQGDGSQRSLDNAKNLNLNYGVGLDWTVFDGFKMFIKREQLQTLEKQGSAQLKMTILSKISSVYSVYYDIVQQRQQLVALDSAMVISNQRLVTAQNRYSIGKAAKLEVLNAQVDLNTDASVLLKQKQTLQNTKIQLNEILARSIDTPFEVENKIDIDNFLNLNELKSLAEKQNPQLESLILEKNNAELQWKQTKSARYPSLRITSGYNFSHSEASLGFITQSDGRGFTYGFSAALPLFNGGLQNRNEKIAKIQLENTSFSVEQQKLSLQSQLANTFENYQTYLELTKLELKNVEIAKQNLAITLAKFKIGTITSLEFRTAQQNNLDAQVRYSNVQYLAKIYEIRLKELAGNLAF